MSVKVSDSGSGHKQGPQQPLVNLGGYISSQQRGVKLNYQRATALLSCCGVNITSDGVSHPLSVIHTIHLIINQPLHHPLLRRYKATASFERRRGTALP
ncbi:hypothetical protein NQZ68_030812 [Dissostichus eleginoides]|nr:hypothetical protein NQZ68_030812 [Dissostichus eleginoides]